ncbi:hypothetical protein ACIBI3_05570 [Actinomadura luteofluorescens]|uniref:hypothetical protein n=1 Tax=Actinomadura luteofluorescens TaxID=46163 RepID=UPI00348C1D3D
MPELATVTLNLSHPTCRKGLTQVTLRPGLIDDQAIEVFGFSMCALLACALHEETGWPILGVETQLPTGRKANGSRFSVRGIRRRRRPAGCWGWSHVGVQTPCGRFLDIQGARTCAEAQREWSALENDAPARTVVLSTFTDLRRWMKLPFGTRNSWWKRDWSSDSPVSVADGLAPFASALVDAYQAQANVAA